MVAHAYHHEDDDDRKLRSGDDAQDIAAGGAAGAAGGLAVSQSLAEIDAQYGGDASTTAALAGPDVDQLALHEMAQPLLDVVQALLALALAGAAGPPQFRV